MRRKWTSKPPYLRAISLRDCPRSDDYPFSLPIVRKGFAVELTKAVTILAGENGSGKSTFLEAIAAACGFNAQGGNANHLYGARADEQKLQKYLRLSWLPKKSQGFFFRAESFFNYASYIDDLAREFGGGVHGPYGGRSMHEQSHGEAFLSLFDNRLKGGGIIILDEPESALSPSRQILFLAILRRIVEEGNAQIIMATHSPILMSYPDSDFLYISDGVFERMDYRNTDHYKTIRRFLENPQTYLDPIFGDLGSR